MPLFITDTDVRRFDELAAGIPGTRRTDVASPGLYFARELEQRLAEVLETKRPALNGMRLFARRTDVNANARTFTRKRFDSAGVAKWISDYTQDLPRVGVSASEETFQVKTLGNEFGWTIEDILAAQFTGTPIDMALANAARRAHEEFINHVIWNGDESVGIHGVLNYPYLPRYIFDNPIATGTSADVIIAALTDMVFQGRNRTKQIAVLDRMVVAPSIYSYLRSTPRASNSDTTILEFFLRNNGHVKTIEEAWELEGAGPDGEHLIINFPLDPTVLGVVAPTLFQVLPVQQKSLSYSVPCWSRCGGVVSDFPLEATIGLVPAE